MRNVRSWPHHNRVVILVLVALAAAAATSLFAPRVFVEHHDFADKRRLLGVPNFLDVFSNSAFLAVGLLGLWFLLKEAGGRTGSTFWERWERWLYAVFFLGTFAVGLGSAYYHLAPDDGRLFWDRLPMTVVFTALVGIVFVERVGPLAGARLFAPLVLLGVGSAFYWRFLGDLRPYIFVQYAAGPLALLMLALFPARYTHGHLFAGIVGYYALAKLCELWDVPIFALGELVSGHTLKHLAAAMGLHEVLRMLSLRRAVEGR